MKTGELTRRQREVCEKVCLGWENKEIAVSLGISSRTIEDHRRKIYDKMKVRNAVELVREIYKIGVCE